MDSTDCAAYEARFGWNIQSGMVIIGGALFVLGGAMLPMPLA